jgi:putative transposon-encoded protein
MCQDSCSKSLHPCINYDDVVHDVKRKLQECHELARANLMQSKQRRVTQHASEVNMPKFYVGDKVLLRN